MLSWFRRQPTSPPAPAKEPISPAIASAAPVKFIGVGNTPLGNPEYTTWETECGRMARFALYAAWLLRGGQHDEEAKRIKAQCAPYEALGMIAAADHGTTMSLATAVTMRTETMTAPLKIPSSDSEGTHRGVGIA